MRSYPALLSAATASVGETRGHVALVVIDVKDLADLRALAGFEASDALTANLLESIRGAARSRDTVMQVGDASYAVLIPDVHNVGHAVLGAEKIARLARDTITAAGTAIRAEVHLGVALYPDHANQASELIRRAQMAAASARRRGQRLLVYDPRSGEQDLKRWELERDFANALETGEIEMHFQPKISLSDGQPTGVEALMRWLRDGATLAPPDVFIPLVEEAGLMDAATLYAMNSALRQAAAWPHLGVAVNVTPGVIRERDFVELIKSALATWKLSAERLTLEITEGALVSDVAETMATLQRLRDLGVRISIDDFGTGYSSLSYFKKIPADELKIDKSFVSGMLKDEADESIVRTIIGLGHRFKLKIVAEGVEDRGTLKVLADMQCDYAQGYLFTPALNQDKLLAWLASTPRRAWLDE